MSSCSFVVKSCPGDAIGLEPGDNEGFDLFLLIKNHVIAGLGNRQFSNSFFGSNHAWC
jgi:hypothetical protein